MAIEEGIFGSLIEFHKAQVQYPGYLTLDSGKHPSPPSIEEPPKREQEEDRKVKPPPNRKQRGKAGQPSKDERDTALVTDNRVNSQLSPGVPPKQPISTRSKTKRPGG